MRLDNYLTEVSTKDATDMELSIVQAWKGEPLSRPDQEETAVQVVEFLKSQGIKRTGNAKHMGRAKGSLSSSWKKYGGTDTTPKTDIIIEGRKISLKKTGASQLMSGKVGESRATFYSVAEKLGIDVSILSNKMEDYFNTMIKRGTSPLGVGATKKTGGVAKSLILAAEKHHKTFTAFLKEQLEKDTSLRNALIQEAMSGDIKFGRGEAAADYLLVFDPKGKNQWHSTHDESYINSVASNTKVRVSFKSTSSTTKARGKEYTFFSVLRLLGKSLADETERHGDILTEEVSEAIFSKIKNWFSRKWKGVKSWISSSLTNMLEFLETEAEMKIGDSKL